MAESLKEVQHVCPLLLPADTKRLSYSGFIRVKDKSFYLKISLPDDGDVHYAKIDCDWQLRNYLSKHQAVLKKKLLLARDLPSFLIDFKMLLNQIMSLQAQPLPPPNYYSRLISEIEEIGWNRLSHIDTKFQDIQITLNDTGGRVHVLSIHLPYKYPIEPPVCNAVLPLAFQPNWSSSTTLADIVRQFEKVILEYQRFWDVLDELDKKTWVLDPSSPSLSSTYRRIVIRSHLSLQVTIDPLHPQLMPECTPLGPTEEVKVIKDRLYSRGQQCWNTRCSVLENLQNILSVNFPSPISTKEEDYIMECGICYTHRHYENGRAPDFTCDNKQCSQPYHVSCLYEWLTSLTSTRKSFGFLFGECLYCNEAISVKLMVPSVE
ncbi:PREDICTED: E3 ubiquitin-protein ligase FANCL-like [Amphimedon queenslandica]|uniref:RING-type domain-containing protein n=1 Tax=Amphimedon queenslandica TaxID=400682 RepID=A0A1X7VAR9_AMPQE|nr:PREDICTED: E3 ubiquitin-protein ligase FANCL-like [Amphimedon queenslandica]|eukprot:XP_019849844.1 PREDICTED: E3 ubiquitin-protein ligase FANCL-like [Amphimedon queenslandica]